MRTTLGRELIRSKLPEKYKGWADKVLDKKNLTELMTQMALDDPDGYVDVLQDLNNLGQTVVSLYGRNTALPFEDIKISKGVKSLNKQLHEVIDKVLNDDNLTEKQKEAKITDLCYKYTKKVEDAVFADNDRRSTAFASQINSGSRGNKTQLMQMQFGNMGMKDALNRDMPYMMIDPYAIGASPMGYWVSASSGRKGYYDVQMATGQSGYLGKRVTAATHDTVISEDDCGTTDTGIPFPANSEKNVGAVLLRPWHNYPAGTVVTGKMVGEADDDEEMVLRSPITCKSRHGICAKCSGLGENGKFPGIGEFVPMNAARSFVEVMTQSSVGCLAPNTLVRMADWTTKCISDIQEGDTVIGVGVDGSARPVRVTRTYIHGLMPMYQWSYRKGSKTHCTAALVATENHKALQATRKSMCKDEINNNIPRILPLGEKTKHIAMVPLQAPIERNGGQYVPEALYLGMMLGDGCYTDGVLRQPHFSCADPSLIEDTKAYMSSLDMQFIFHKGSECYYRVVGTEPANVPGEIRRRNPGRVFLEKHNLIGKYAFDKELPADFLTWDDASLSALISGLIITDGCLSRIYTERATPYVSYASTSLKMVEQVRDAILIGCGALCTRIKESPNNRKHTLYSISYAKSSEVLKLLRWLKLYGVKEAKRLEYLKELEDWLPSATLAESGTYWKLIDKEFVGYIMAYDIEVDHPDHLFLLANGLVVSNSKHKGGVGGRKVVDPEGEDQPTGFRAAERMFTVPKNFPGGAVLTPVDGTVTNIQAAPQGGSYITVGGSTVYASPARTIKVKVGDKVYAGDVLTNGVPNPADIVGYKGLGEGRRYFTNKLNTVLKDLGWGTDRRNIESFSRAFLNKVEITDPDGFGNYLPGDIVDYSAVAADWEPRENSITTKADKALNMYLEKPVLYYSVGTRITPEVANTLKKYKFDDVTVSDKEPPFSAKFLRPTEALQHSQYWLPRMAGERLRDSLFDAARQGITDPYDSPSYVDKIVAQPFKP